MRSENGNPRPTLLEHDPRHCIGGAGARPKGALRLARGSDDTAVGSAASTRRPGGRRSVRGHCPSHPCLCTKLEHEDCRTDAKFVNFRDLVRFCERSNASRSPIEGKTGPNSLDVVWSHLSGSRCSWLPQVGAPEMRVDACDACQALIVMTVSSCFGWSRSDNVAAPKVFGRVRAPGVRSSLSLC
jgi:hypothetical protein